jgi:hypothetical protein
MKQPGAPNRHRSKRKLEEMKTCLTAMLGVLCAGRLLAQEITSGVVHQYSYVGLSLGFAPEDGGYIRFEGSVEYRDCLLWLTSENVFHTSGGIGYVIRLNRNHVNIVPRLGAGCYYLAGWGSDVAVEPSITFSYAFNHRFSVDAGYTVGVVVDSGSSINTLNLGATFAFAKRWGVRLDAALVTDHGERNGFFAAGIAFHF